MDRLWLDAHDYGVQLLRGGIEPWREPAMLGPFCGEIAALLKPDRLVVPVAPLLLASLAGASNPAAALDGALQSGAIAGSLDTGLATLVHGAAAGIAVPLLPGPTLLGCDPGDEDALDDCVAALAVVLRQLLSVRLSGAILIDEPAAAARDALGPLRRIADHGGAGLWVLGEGLEAVAWDMLTTTADARDMLVVIPVDAAPESVLARLAALRSAERGS